jgi:hypothetical protein
MNRIELKQMGGRLGASGHLVDVDELEFGVVAQRPHGEPPDAAETIDANGGHDAPPMR